MTYRLLSPALFELREAALFYESRVPGLGCDFLVEFRRALSRILANPTAWVPLDVDIRRCRTHRFPYGLIYAIEGGEVLIISVMHLHRHPDSWRNRR